MLWKGFQKPKRLAVDTSSLTDKYGIFWAQPFERGFGTTVGNALRRGRRFRGSPGSLVGERLHAFLPATSAIASAMLE